MAGTEASGMSLQHKFIVLARQGSRMVEPSYAEVDARFERLRTRGIRSASIHLAAALPPNDKWIPKADYDCICELVVEHDAPIAGLLAELPLTHRWIYHVEEMAEKAELAPKAGEQTPGLLWFAPLEARPELTLDQLRERYDRHVGLALEVHGAMKRYSRHWTLRKLGDDAPDYFGFSLLHFASDSDFIHRHYATSEGQQRIYADVQGFLNLDHLQPLAARSYKLV